LANFKALIELQPDYSIGKNLVTFLANSAGLLALPNLSLHLPLEVFPHGPGTLKEY